MKQNSFTSKLANRLSTLSVATFVSLGAGLGIAGGASAIGFNGLTGYAGASFVRAIGGAGIIAEPPENTANGTESPNIILTDSTALLIGPDTGNGASSYIDWYLTPTTGDVAIRFSLSFLSNDAVNTDDTATYYTIAGAYTGNPGAKIVDGGQIDASATNPNVVPGVVTVPIAMGNTFVFRVSSALNDGGGTGELSITDFEAIPFDFAPTYGVIFVGTALGLNEWRKKRRASKKDQTDETDQSV
jgi:hypothetical protein